MANLYDKSSLVMIPSGKKDGTVFSQKPIDGTGDFTFLRGSNLAATRVGPTGLIEKGRENLLLQSNNFDTTPWQDPNGAVATGGESGYDGTNDAWKLEASIDASGVRVQQGFTQSGVSTLSIYAKEGTTNWIRLEFGGASSIVYFDLTEGAGDVGTELNAIGKIEDVGGGWFRCSAINTSGSTPSQARFHLASADGDISVTAGANVYIQDAQLEIGLAATDYIESGATTGKAGLLEDEPRFDYSGGATCPSLLLEPSRKNLIPQSEYFNFSGYTTFASSFTDNATTSPEGLQNAAELSGDGTTGQIFFRENLSVASTGQYTYSLFAKYKANSDATNIALHLTDFGSGNGTCYFDIENGVKGTESGVTGKIEDYGNGWYRCSITTDFTDGGDLGGRLQFYLANSAESFSFSPNNANAQAYFYGLQLELGSYPTSYIPNHSGGIVTRGADFPKIEGASATAVAGQGSGTIYAEMYFPAVDGAGTSTYFYMTAASSYDNSVLIGREPSTGGKYFFYLRAGGAFLINNATIPVLDQYSKLAIAYESGSYAAYLNGTLVASGTDAFSFTAPFDKIGLGLNNSGMISGALEASLIKQALLFKTRLSNTDLETLTT
jgi:hypothetical protein